VLKPAMLKKAVQKLLQRERSGRWRRRYN